MAVGHFLLDDEPSRFHHKFGREQARVINSSSSVFNFSYFIAFEIKVEDECTSIGIFSHSHSDDRMNAIHIPLRIVFNCQRRISGSQS